MKFIEAVSDDAALKELGRRIARYRLNKNLTQGALAKEAGVSLPTVQRIEYGHSTQAVNLFRILRVLGLLVNLEALIPEQAISPIQQVRMHGKKRQRASSKTDKSEPETPWSWGG
ncbi:MAG: helix-turn-helix transcriptional regulator [Proteobacteria bacterium]|nr:helix-turn-helix transcriptional regulator [Pseudomonadota bacterium]